MIRGGYTLREVRELARHTHQDEPDRALPPESPCGLPFGDGYTCDLPRGHK